MHKTNRMKRILPLLAAMIALTTVLPGKAQTGKYYIDGRETTREELLKLPAGTIESIRIRWKTDCP